ncbi:MAG: outer membrane protein assembly factor BamB [Pseudomonadales bacterium]
MKNLSRLLVAFTLLSLMTGCALFSKDKDEGPAPTPLVKFKAQAKLDKQWSAKVGSGIGETYTKLTPAIDGSNIYAADAKGVIAAFDRKTGKRQWRVSLKEPLSGGVGAGYGLVLVGTSSGHLVALSQEDGSQLWRAAVSSEILSAPKTNASTVVVQTLDENIYGFDHITGERRWQYESSAATLSLRGTSSPVVTSEVAIVGMGNGQIVALNPANGALLWKQRAGVPQGRSEFERMTDVDGDLLLAGDTLYATSFQGFVVALSASTGRPLWRRELSSFHGPDEGLGNLYVSDANDQLHALSQSDNEQAWIQKALLNRHITAPITFANYVAVADGEGYLHVLSQRDGSFVARKKIDGDGVSTSLLAKGKTLYVYGNSGKLVALTVE